MHRTQGAFAQGSLRPCVIPVLKCFCQDVLKISVRLPVLHFTNKVLFATTSYAIMFGSDELLIQFWLSLYPMLLFLLTHFKWTFFIFSCGAVISIPWSYYSSSFCIFFFIFFIFHFHLFSFLKNLLIRGNDSHCTQMPKNSVKIVIGTWNLNDKIT